MSHTFKLRNGRLLISTEAPGGIYNASQLKRIASLCDGDSVMVKATEDQRLALIVDPEKASMIANELKAIGLGLRHYQDGLHHPVSCIGEMCEYHEQDALGSALDISAAIDGIKLDNPLKIGINGCARCCVPCHTLDVSVVADGQGYRISLGGKNSQLPEFAGFLAEGVPPQEIPRLMRSIIEIYKSNATEGETLQELIDRQGASFFIKALAPWSQDAADTSDPFAFEEAKQGSTPVEAQIDENEQPHNDEKNHEIPVEQRIETQHSEYEGQVIDPEASMAHEDIQRIDAEPGVDAAPPEPAVTEIPFPPQSEAPGFEPLLDLHEEDSPAQDSTDELAPGEDIEKLPLEADAESPEEPRPQVESDHSEPESDIAMESSTTENAGDHHIGVQDVVETEAQLIEESPAEVSHHEFSYDQSSSDAQSPAVQMTALEEGAESSFERADLVLESGEAESNMDEHPVNTQDSKIDENHPSEPVSEIAVGEPLADATSESGINTIIENNAEMSDDIIADEAIAEPQAEVEPQAESNHDDHIEATDETLVEEELSSNIVAHSDDSPLAVHEFERDQSLNQLEHMEVSLAPKPSDLPKVAAETRFEIKEEIDASSNSSDVQQNSGPRIQTLKPTNSKKSSSFAGFDVDDNGNPVITWSNGTILTLTPAAIEGEVIKFFGHDIRISRDSTGLNVEVDGIRMFLPIAA